MPADIELKEEEKGIVQYQINNQPIKLSVAIVRKFFCPDADDLSAMVFMGFCRAKQLDPFGRDVYLTMMDGKPVIQVAYTTFMKRGEGHHKYDGFIAGTILKKTTQDAADLVGEDGVIPSPLVACPGEFVPEGYTIVGGWCKVFRKDRSRPFISTVGMADYDKGFATWKKIKATMIRKTSVAHCFRDAFPNETAGLYLKEEFGVPENQQEEIVLQPKAGNMPVPAELLPMFELLGWNEAARQMFTGINRGRSVEEMKVLLAAKLPQAEDAVILSHATGLPVQPVPGEPVPGQPPTQEDAPVAQVKPQVAHKQPILADF